MSAMSEVFRTLDNWRHLPAYQLERRVDIFFGLFLPGVIERKFCVSDAEVIPEFPLHKGAIGKSKNNRSVKVDFAVFANGGEQKKRIFLVELKTDIRSLNRKQLDNMKAAKRARLRKLLCGVIEAARASSEPRKYAQLLWKLRDLCCLEVGSGFEHMRLKDPYRGLTRNFGELHVSPELDDSKPDLVVILPKTPKRKEEKEMLSGFFCITFEDFSADLAGDDAFCDSGFVSTFRHYLEEWARLTAGERDL